MTSAEAHSLLMTGLIGGVTNSQENNRTIANNGVSAWQATMVLLTQEKLAVSDDSGLAMALNTASRIPDSGALPRSGGQ